MSEGMRMVVINGALVAEEEAQVSLLDRNIQLGMSVFETFLADSGKVNGFSLHVERLKKGMKRLHLVHNQVDAASLRESIEGLLEVNDLSDKRARVRITAIAGILMIQAEEAMVSALACRVVISKYRLNEHGATAGIKCGSYAANMIALREHDIDEVIFLNTAGEVAEAAMANLFMVKDGGLMTPRLESGCLPGVTRELVIRRVRAAGGVEVKECAVMLEDLLGADEVFLTNSVGGVRSVSCVGDIQFKSDAVTQQVRNMYQNGDQ